MRRVMAVMVLLAALMSLAATASAKVLRVGTYHGIRGEYQSLQAAVKKAKAGDWVLVAPGDYKTKPNLISTPKGYAEFPSSVLVTAGHVHIRGMNRNSVIIDGTKPGTARCSRASSAQNFGFKVKGAKPSGVNGIMIWKAPDVSVENLTTCNFLGGSQSAGNGIWWNGGDNSGKVGGHGFYGGYLNATSTYLKSASAAGEYTAAQYGIFTSNWNGGTWNHVYASNFNDSGFYIGACQMQCNQIVNHAWGEYSALGYSGSNSGGKLVVENSEFDNNEDGFDTNSQNGDNPPPQDGACPAGVTPPVTGAKTCWVFTRNYVHDNNNPNVPASGSAAAGPVGTGMTVSGGRNDTIIHNRFVNNHAWGLAIVPYTDSGKSCPGGTLNSPLTGKGTCLWDDYGDAVIDNTFANNGGYGNPTNGAFDALNLENNHPTNCYSGNTDSSGHLSADAASLEQMYPTCTGAPVAANLNVPFLDEILCDSQTSVPPFGCQPGDKYPRVTHIVMHPLPTKKLTTMPKPCQGVPSNPWCTKKK